MNADRVLRFAVFGCLNGLMMHAWYAFSQIHSRCWLDILLNYTRRARVSPTKMFNDSIRVARNICVRFKQREIWITLRAVTFSLCMRAHRVASECMPTECVYSAAGT